MAATLEELRLPPRAREGEKGRVTEASKHGGKKKSDPRSGNS